MAKKISRGGKGYSFDPFSGPAVPVQKYQRKFWKDYSDQELRGMGFGRGMAVSDRERVTTIVISIIVILLFIGGLIWLEVFGIP
jgi:hypothetical protein